jgi:hypothetical protein
MRAPWLDELAVDEALAGDRQAQEAGSAVENAPVGGRPSMILKTRQRALSRARARSSTLVWRRTPLEAGILPSPLDYLTAGNPESRKGTSIVVAEG